MAVVAGRRTQIGVKEFGRDVDVPFDDHAQLMYYIHSMCVVLDLSKEPGLTRLRDYANYQRLTEAEKAALLLLCVALNPIELNGKCIFPVEQIKGGFPNQFLELSATQTNFVASSNVLVGGRSRQVTSIMLYTREWIHQCYLNPLGRIVDDEAVEQAPPRRAIAPGVTSAEQSMAQRRAEEEQKLAAERRALDLRAAELREQERRLEEERKKSKCVIQ